MRHRLCTASTIVAARRTSSPRGEGGVTVSGRCRTAWPRSAFDCGLGSRSTGRTGFVTDSWQLCPDVGRRRRPSSPARLRDGVLAGADRESPSHRPVSGRSGRSWCPGRDREGSRWPPSIVVHLFLPGRSSHRRSLPRNAGRGGSSGAPRRLSAEPSAGAVRPGHAGVERRLAGRLLPAARGSLRGSPSTAAGRAASTGSFWSEGDLRLRPGRLGT